VLSQADIDTLLAQLQAELAAKDARLVVWFAANRRRIQALTRILSVLESQLGEGVGLRQAADLTLEQARNLVVAQYPEQQAWFETNIVLLRLIALRLFKLNQAKRQHGEPTAGNAQPEPRAQRVEPDGPIDAKVVPILLSSEPPPDFSAIVPDLTGRADRIAAYLATSGLPGDLRADGSGPVASGLAALSERQLEADLRARTQQLRAAQNMQLSVAAASIGQQNGAGQDESPSIAALRLPENPSNERLRQSLVDRANSSAESVAGLIIFIRSLRAELADKLDSVLAGFGSLDASWSISTSRSGQSYITDLEPNHRNILLGAALARNLRLEVGARTSDAAPESSFSAKPEEEPDLLTPAKRTEANIAAIAILTKGEPYSPSDIKILRSYSGWGGLSIAKIRDRLPPEYVPEERGLIHEYYTPTAVARSIAEVLRPRLPELKDGNGVVRALEPSAGLGRLIRATEGDGFQSVQWVAVEYSKISSALLRAIRPDAAVYNQPFETFVQEHLHERGLFQLVVSNPPYGERGAAASLDPDRAYREKAPWLYQMRRSLEFLQAGGVGVYLIPAGFMTGKRSVEARRKILLMAHLMAAFRLPSETAEGRPLFSGALLVTDVVFLRARGGLLPEIAPDDEAIFKGEYFKRYPSHILGREVGRNGDDEDQSKKPRFGYQVRGEFTGIPSFEERPICRDCTPILFKYERRPRTSPESGLDEQAADALRLARRVSEYFSDVAKGDVSSTLRARAAQPELREAVLAWHAQDQATILRIAGLIKRVPTLQPLFSAFAGGRVIATLENPPTYEERFQGNPDDIPAIATFLHSSSQDTSPEAIAAYHQRLGGEKTADQVRAELAAAGFAFDLGRLIPENEYYSGALWDKYDRASQLAAAGDEMAAVQASRLLDVIRPANFAELEVEPRLGWLPVDVISAFIRAYSSQLYRDDSQYEVERIGPLLTLKDLPYDALPFNVRSHVVELLGYLNHDLVYFKPDRLKEESIEKARERRATAIREFFTDWIEANGYWQKVIANTFNRLYRGWNPPTYPKQPILLARWNETKPLFGYQWSGVRRLNANHGGGLFFDVGLGKTRTLLAALALARQQGWARRPAILVPNSVVFNWLAELERVLPDYRPVIIGVKKKAVMRGPRRGEVESETDTPRERADKWERFKAGLYDVAIITYSSLSRTKIRQSRLVDIVRRVPAIRRELGLQSRSVQQRIQQLEKKPVLTEEQRAELRTLREKFKNLSVTERRAAIQAEREEAFVADLAELPAGQEYDPGIYWDDLGIDWIACDESHIAKNLWTVGPREGGALKFLGAPQAPSGIAYQVFFRCAIVREQSGGRGVHLGDATPAKNSPLEFLSLLSFLDDNVWGRLGVLDSEQYVTQFLKIERRLVTDTDLSVIEAPCVVGFKNCRWPPRSAAV